MRPSGPGLYFDGRLNYSLLIIGLVRYFISYDSVIVQCIYVENLFISLYIIFLRDLIYLKPKSDTDRKRHRYKRDCPLAGSPIK